MDTSSAETGAAGRLVLLGTPIGNLEDISLRALRTLGEADVLACEDPGRTRGLLARHGVRTPELLVYNEGNEAVRAGELTARIAGGDTVVVVTAAGMPSVSDPGYRLVRQALEAGLAVEVVPGPTALAAALVVSGLPPGRFCFEGFLPRKERARRRRIAELSSEPRTLVLYESARRVEGALADLAGAFGPRPAALARELSKMFEEVRRGTLPELLDGVRSEPPRGEIVLVVGGADEPSFEVAADELARRAVQLMDEGVARPEALRRVARDSGVARRVVFDALAGRDGSSSGKPPRETEG